MNRALAFAAVVAVGAGLAAAPALADEPRVIKLATLAPEGTLWSRELHAVAQEIEAGTNGAVHLKIYLGAVAGDETEVAARIGKGQLDAVASAGVMCDRASPTLRAISIPGLFATRAEAVAVSLKLRAAMDAEAEKSGYQLLGVTALGQDVLFTRRPVRSMTELRALKLWRWDGDDAGIATARAMGLDVVPTPVPEAMAAIETGRIDGFMAIPTAALAFQWSTRTRYLTSLRSGHLNGCILVANRAFDRVAVEHQQVIRSVVSKLAVRLDEISRREDDALVGTLFARQGLEVSAPSPELRDDFFAAAQKARATLGEALVPREVFARVLKALAEARAK